MEPAAEGGRCRGVSAPPLPAAATGASRQPTQASNSAVNLAGAFRGGTGELHWALCPLSDERWQRRVPEVPPPASQDTLPRGSGTLQSPDRERDICRQQNLGVFLLLNKVNYLFMHKTQVIVC